MDREARLNNIESMLRRGIEEYRRVALAHVGAAAVEWASVEPLTDGENPTASAMTMVACADDLLEDKSRLRHMALLLFAYLDPSSLS